MSEDPTWPPSSARAAMLSSPSGRRKLEERRRLNGYGNSPTKAPSRRDALYGGGDSEEDEDEETLQLKLAQIEAKLKLKKLQQNKQKNMENDLPISAVEVPLSPTKRLMPQIEPRSPGRILLGIDKGFRGADISLGRARTGAGSPLKTRSTAFDDRPFPRPSVYSSVRSTASTPSTVQTSVKSFSERMAEIREKGRAQDNKRDNLQKKRTIAGFKANESELESYRKAAEEASKHNRPRATVARPQTVFSRADILATQQQTTSRLAKSQSTPNLRRSPSRVQSTAKEAARPTSSGSQGDSSLYEDLSGIHLTTRILPHSFLKRTLPIGEYTVLTVPDLLRQVTSPAYELPDLIVSFAIIGIVASKSSPLNQKVNGEDKFKGGNDWEKKWEDGSQNQKRFMVFELTDLKWRVNLYLFGTALPRYHRLTPGTVVAILNPGIMPPRKGKEDTGAFSLTLNSSDDTVLEIGTARDFGFCNAVKRDGKDCGEWVNSSKTETCEFHLSHQIARTQSKRMGVNTGCTDMRAKNRDEFAKKSGMHERMTGLAKEGRQFDKFTGTHYYVAASSAGNARGTAPLHHGDRTAAQLMDLDDDPFLAEGQLARDDKAGRLRKHLARMEQESKISRILASDGSGGAGGEYMRKKAGIETGSDRLEKTSIQRTAAEAKVNIMGNGGANKKRTAQEVRLSPAKKTRFITDKGIKVAGRESLPAKDAGLVDSEDDLDIV